ncbi:MAG: Na/Pi cotransporter family protein [Phycisphaerales bacterium]|nr:Na/Pi cotransporter family protein [Phycisphaerales bacterium]
MEMAVSILGGVGLFLLGMAVMTDGLKALAGTALRRLLSRAASTPVRATALGVVVTLIVQSSTATATTTIGLVSAGLMSFTRAIGVVFGANLGTTATAWFVAIVGVKVSLDVAALPLVFAGALLRLLGRKRVSAIGGTLAGFALLLFGLGVLQEGMSGMSDVINPGDLPMMEGVGPWRAVAATAVLVIAGIVMTTLMQSSTAAVAVTIAALHAGAIAPDQAAALVVGQNVGSALSTGIAGIGATTAAQRTALAHVLFNVITAAVVLCSFPVLIPWLDSTAQSVDPTLLLAGFHTAFNVLGVSMLLPMVGRFSALIERILPERGPVLTRHLDRASQTMPDMAVEAARRTVAMTLELITRRAQAAIEARQATPLREAIGDGAIEAAKGALDETREFLSQMARPPEQPEAKGRLTNALHALDHSIRLVENIEESAHDSGVDGDDAALRVLERSRAALELASSMCGMIAGPSDGTQAGSTPASRGALLLSQLATLRQLSEGITGDARLVRRGALGSAIAAGAPLAVDRVMARVDAVRHIDRIVHHAWRSLEHLVAGGAEVSRIEGSGMPATSEARPVGAS